MKKLFRFSCLVVLSALALVGCSNDDGTSPTGVPNASFDRPRPELKTIGPSEIALCLDVSDNVSAEQLQGVVTALETCLGDPTLIPPDGDVAVAAFVYGDTVAAALETPVPVTPENLESIILPALRGLLDDRLVGTSGSNLASALEAARMVLDPGTVADRHVLVVSGGGLDDVLAVAASCSAIGDAGVMMSIVAFGAEESNYDLFRTCTESTGGFFGAAGTDLTGTCSAALAYMLQVDIDLEPESAELMRGGEHTVTAMVFRGGDPELYPVGGLEVDFEIVAGPNLGETASAATDTDGVVDFSYVGDGGPGTDTIVAETLHPGTGVALSDTVTVDWMNSAPTCAAGGPYEVTVDADTVRVTLDGSESSDAEGDSLRFSWAVDCEEASFDDATSATPVLTVAGDCLCADSLVVDLVVSDGFDESACQAVVHFDDVRPPVIEVREQPLRLWPPNHKYREITPEMVIVRAVDACGRPIDLSNATVLEVRSDEPEDEQGDGSTLEDIIVDCPSNVMLRAERTGGGNGRVYTIVYRIALGDGDYQDVDAKVAVPHDSSDRLAVEDPGAVYVVEPACEEER